jgi:hypothetical protein
MSQNMFGESAGTMKDMWKRMTRNQENDAKKMHQKLNEAGDAKKLSQIAEKVVKGGDVFDLGLYDEKGLQSGGEISDIAGAVSSNFGVSFNPNP